MSERHIKLLKKHSLSLTPIRLAVLAVLDGHPHSDADTVFQNVKERISTTSKQAIYHNLNTLVSHKIIREIRPKGKPSLYENRIDDNHHHIVCRACETVMDIDCVVGVKPCLAPSDNHGFVIDEAEVIFWGLCPSCQENQPEKGEENHEQR